jgi:hypothetical protein
MARNSPRMALVAETELASSRTVEAAAGTAYLHPVRSHIREKGPRSYRPRSGARSRHGISWHRLHLTAVPFVMFTVPASSTVNVLLAATRANGVPSRLTPWHALQPCGLFS